MNDPSTRTSFPLAESL